MGIMPYPISITHRPAGQPEIKIVLAYCTVSPVRIRPMAWGTRFLNSTCGSYAVGMPFNAAANFWRVAGVLCFKNSPA